MDTKSIRRCHTRAQRMHLFFHVTIQLRRLSIFGPKTQLPKLSRIIPVSGKQAPSVPLCIDGAHIFHETPYFYGPLLLNSLLERFSSFRSMRSLKYLVWDYGRRPFRPLAPRSQDRFWERGNHPDRLVHQRFAFEYA